LTYSPGVCRTWSRNFDVKWLSYSYAAPHRSRSAYRFTVEHSVYVDRHFLPGAELDLHCRHN
jgi:L-amino acid N-acyltransferase YncA